jgi:hypothetical protein
MIEIKQFMAAKKAGAACVFFTKKSAVFWSRTVLCRTAFVIRILVRGQRISPLFGDRTKSFSDESPWLENVSAGLRGFVRFD